MSNKIRPRERAEAFGVRGTCKRITDRRYQVSFFCNDVPYVAHAYSPNEAWRLALKRWLEIPTEDRDREILSR